MLNILTLPRNVLFICCLIASKGIFFDIEKFDTCPNACTPLSVLPDEVIFIFSLNLLKTIFSISP